MNNLRTSPLKFLQKPSPPIFFMVHLLHRLYGVDAPVHEALISLIIYFKFTTGLFFLVFVR